MKEIRKKERAEAKAKEREELIRATEIRVRREDAAARAAAAVGSSHAAVLPRSPPLNYGNDDAIRPRSKDKRRKDEGRNEPQGKIDSSAAAVAAARHACSPMALSSATATSSRELSSCSRTSSTGGVTSSREVSSGTVTSSTSSTSTAALAAARHASWGAEQANDIPRSSKAPGGGNRKFGRDKRHGESRPKSNTPSERIIIDRQRPRDSANVVRQRIPNITRTKSALADRLNPCPVLRFGPPEDRDIELYIGLEPIMCFKLHSRMVFGNALVLERGISGTLETTTAGRKYRTVLVVDGCNQPRFWAAHKVSIISMGFGRWS